MSMNEVALTSSSADERARGPLVVIVSAAGRDEDLERELRSHLRSLEEAGDLRLWSSHDVSAGGARQQALATKLREADLVVPLFSADLFNSEDGRGELVKLVQAKVVPIRVRAYREDFFQDVSGFRGLPEPLPTTPEAREPLWVLVATDLKERVLPSLTGSRGAPGQRASAASPGANPGGGGRPGQPPTAAHSGRNVSLRHGLFVLICIYIITSCLAIYIYYYPPAPLRRVQWARCISRLVAGSSRQVDAQQRYSCNLRDFLRFFAQQEGREETGLQPEQAVALVSVLEPEQEHQAELATFWDRSCKEQNNDWLACIKHGFMLWEKRDYGAACIDFKRACEKERPEHGKEKRAGLTLAWAEHEGAMRSSECTWSEKCSTDRKTSLKSMCEVEGILDACLLLAEDIQGTKDQEKKLFYYQRSCSSPKQPREHVCPKEQAFIQAKDDRAKDDPNLHACFRAGVMLEDLKRLEESRKWFRIVCRECTVNQSPLCRRADLLARCKESEAKL